MALPRPRGNDLHEAKGSDGEAVEEPEKTVGEEDVGEVGEFSKKIDEGEEEEEDGETEGEADLCIILDVVISVFSSVNKFDACVAIDSFFSLQRQKPARQ